MIQSQEKPGQLKNKKSFSGEGVGEKEKRSYLPNIFRTSLRNDLPKFFIKILLAFFPFIGIHLALVRYLRLECHVQVWALQCKEGRNILEPVQWRASRVLRSTGSERAGLVQPGEGEAVG